MKNISKIAFAITLMGLLFSCESEELEITDQSLEQENLLVTRESSSSGDTPWEFDNDFDNSDDFQADNDGGGAHNWNESEYRTNPDRNDDRGFDIRDFIYVDNNGKLILQCPNTSGNNDPRRRAEYRDQENIDLDRAHRLDFTFDIRDYNNNDELIMAQLHNDNSNASRPYLTVVAENGTINLKRADAPTGSSTTTSSFSIPFRTNDRYRIRMNSQDGTRSVFVRIINLDTNERAQTTFNWRTAWNSLDGSFYWKLGAYMPDGGSNNTCMRVERVGIQGQ